MSKNNQYVFGQGSFFSKEAKIQSNFVGSDINKSDLGYAFGNSNPDMNSLKFPKRGEELIKMLTTKRDSLQEKYNTVESQKLVLKAKLTELGIEFKERVNDDESKYYEPIWVYDQTDDAIKKIIYEYQDLNYPCRELKKEIKTATALIDNLDNKKTYTLSTPQLISLQKAMEFDIEKAVFTEKSMDTNSTPGGKEKIEKSEDDENSDDAMFAKAESPEQKTKMEKVMKEFKDKKLKSGSGELVTERKQAIAIAMDEAGLNKSEDSDIEKAFETLGL